MFRIRNVPQESLNALVLIECPRLLFPFAREIIATAVRNGGFPPLLLDPVDFAGLYRQKMARCRPPARRRRRAIRLTSGDNSATSAFSPRPRHEFAVRREFGFAQPRRQCHGRVRTRPRRRRGLAAPLPLSARPSCA